MVVRPCSAAGVKGTQCCLLAQHADGYSVHTAAGEHRYLR